MTRILLLGSGPLPRSGARRVTAAGFRAEAIRTELLRGGHDVRMVLLQDEAVPDEEGVRVVPGAFCEDAGFWEGVLDDERPDGVVTCSYHATLVLEHLPEELPLWCDLCGDLFSEAQVKSAATGVDSWSRDHLHVGRLALRRGDVFSAVSTRQRHALLGQLGLAGRLTGRTLGCPLVHTIPVSVPASVSDLASSRNVDRGDRGDGRPRVYMGGSFNNWIDVDLLVSVMERLRARDVVWVMTGGEVPGLNGEHLGRFLSRMDEVGLADSLERPGWIPFAELAGVLAGCDVGLNVDLECVETELGSRSRILHGLAAGLPWVSTPGTELVEQLSGKGMVVVADRSPGGIAAALERVLESEEPVVERSRLEELFGAEVVMAPLLEWAAAPARAPDRSHGDGGAGSAGKDVESLHSELLRVRRLEEGLRKELDGAWARVEELVDLERKARADLVGVQTELQAVHDSITWRVLRGIDRLLGRG